MKPLVLDRRGVILVHMKAKHGGAVDSCPRCIPVIAVTKAHK